MKKFIFTGFVFVAIAALSGCAQPAAVEPGAEDSTQSSQSQANVTPPSAQTNVSTASAGLVAIYFDFDSYAIRGDQQNSIRLIASAIANSSGKSFRLEGNCDEWGTEEYNYALGLRRAKAVQDALVSAGTSIDQLQLISYGESNPVCVQSSSDCWRKNRRVEISILQ